MRIAPYPAYKPSGFPWLGDVPEHWEVRRLKANLVRNDSGVWGDEVDERGTIVLRSTEQTVTGGWRITCPARIRLSEAQRNSALLQAGDLVITKSSGSEAHIGKTSLVNQDVAKSYCCFSNFMQRIRLDESIDPAFIWYNLNSNPGRLQLILQSTTTTGLGNLNATIIGNCLFARPPGAEQAAIVRYLEHMDRRIRRYVSAKQRLIALLEEEKQAVINEAVTRGLDPNVRLKPSGIPWLGDTPEHWETRRLKRLLLERDNRSADGREQLLRVSQYTGVTERKRIDGKDSPDTRAESLAGYKRVSLDDLVVNIMLAWNGSMGVSRFRGIASPAYCVYRFLTGAHPWYFHHLLRSPNYKAYIKTASTGVVESRLRLYTDDLYQLHAPVPPLAEQAAIGAYVETATTGIDAATARARRQVELLEEYRTRLIADVVTGKLDVREAAARLPDEPDDADRSDADGEAEDLGSEFARADAV